MHHKHTPTQAHAAARFNLPYRLLCAVAAVATSSACLGLLLGGFGQQSRMPWLAASPTNLERMALCEPLRGRAEKEACVRGVVAAVVNSPGPVVAGMATSAP